MLQYLLNITAIWLISLLMFDLLLRRESYHGYNRFYLMFTFLLGMLLPLLQIGNNKAGASLDDLLSKYIWLRWVGVIYLTGAAIAFVLLIADIIRLIVFYKAGNKHKQDGWTIVETGKDHPPFSYLDVLFVSERARYNNEEWEMILTHEQRHSVLLHVVDMLFMQIARIVFWFHPLVYIYHMRLLLVHEYQADFASSSQAEKYSKFLVEQSMLRTAPSFSHSFNRSPIKSRILMLARNIKPRTGLSNLKLLLVVPLTLICVLFFSKNSYSINPPGEVWKKQTVRVIDFSQPEDTVRRHIRNAEPDSLLLEMFFNAIYTGKLTAYSNFDTRFTQKLTMEELTGMLVPRPDTILVTDPVTGKEMTKVMKHDFDCSIVHKWRVLEEWTYSERTRKTEIQILGIAPVMNVYVDNELRGVRAIFWLKYNDIQSILARYDLYHPDNSLASRIWEDNFKAEESKRPGN